MSPAQGKFKGQLVSRKYEISVHGLLKPKTVAVNGMHLSENASGVAGPTWQWDDQRRITTIRLPDPLPTDHVAQVEIAGAGTFADALALQKVLNLRQQIRQAKRVMKLRHAQLLGDEDIKKPPRVIRETEKIERRLTALADNPAGLGRNPLDSAALRGAVINALTNQPFESNRTIPESDPGDIAATKHLENGQFTEAQITKIKEILRGADVPGWIFP